MPEIQFNIKTFRQILRTKTRSEERTGFFSHYDPEIHTKISNKFYLQ